MKYFIYTGCYLGIDNLLPDNRVCLEIEIFKKSLLVFE